MHALGVVALSIARQVELLHWCGAFRGCVARWISVHFEGLLPNLRMYQVLRPCRSVRGWPSIANPISLLTQPVKD